MLRSWPLLFIVMPIVELYFIITVGEQIGALWTVVLVLLTAVIGVNLLRFQGMTTLARAQKNMAQGKMPAMEMMEGVALALAGVLLITPGFITDTIGFLLLTPVSRRAIIRYLMSRSKGRGGFGNGMGGRFGGMGGFSDETNEDFQPGNRTQSPPDSTTKTGRTLEGEYRRED
jgi:UPF0716 protein FxsA